ncbi:protein of unknown function [Micromonospora purpureochromogenes]|uniref:DUF4190 domain-containing protein n=2 Tax=Micromonospora purpureochromogenes TaxID=47872 RepID=A0A1C4YEJ5_9ACTN|nr:protein of unknown function [Micromonospora purpureochromogenes]
MTYPQPGHDPTRPLPPVSAVPAGPYPPARPYPPAMQYPPAVPYPTPLLVAALPTSGSATAAMVLGIVGVLGGWCVFGLPCLLAVILGHIGLHETRDGRKSGRGMAVAGLVLGYVFVAPAVALTVMVFFGGVIGAATPTPTSTP